MKSRHFAGIRPSTTSFEPWILGEEGKVLTIKSVDIVAGANAVSATIIQHFKSANLESASNYNYRLNTMALSANTSEALNRTWVIPDDMQISVRSSVSAGVDFMGDGYEE